MEFFEWNNYLTQILCSFFLVMQDLIEEDESVIDEAIKDNVFRFLKDAVVSSKNFNQSVKQNHKVLRRGCCIWKHFDT